jgi:hypothetical protein
MNRLFTATAAIQQGAVHGQFAVSVAGNRELAMTGKVLRWCGAGVDIGGDEMIVMLRANEVFDSAQPDTFACALRVRRVRRVFVFEKNCLKSST